METSYCSKKGRSINSSDPEWLSIPHLSLIIDDDNVEALKEFVRQEPDCIRWIWTDYNHGWYPGWGPVEYAMLRDSFHVFRELLRLEGTTTTTTTKPLSLYPYRLHNACSYGRLNMVQLLLDHVGNLQDALARTDKRGATPLLIATGLSCHSEEAEAIMQLLLDAGANPLQELHSADRWPDGLDGIMEESRRRQGIETPFLVDNVLTTAMGFASPSLIERLFHAGVDIFAGGSYTCQNDAQWEMFISVTPLHHACGRKSAERVQTLLRLGGADAARMLAQRDSMGRTPIHWLFLGEDFHPMFGNYSPLRGRELLQIKQCMQAVRAHDMEMTVINYKDRDGKTAMHLAAESYLPELATYLLEQGADPNLIDSTGRTPLMALIVDFFKRQETRKPVIYSMIGAVDNINAVDDHGNTALHLACSHYTRLWTANVLIEQGALCHVVNGSGQTPLHKAAACLWRPWLNHCNFKSYYDAEQSQDRVVAILLEKCHDLCNMRSKDFSGRCPADILAETRLRASEYIEDEVREEVKRKLERINDAYIRAGFQIMPPGIQDLVETAGGNLALRTTNPRISLRTSLRTGMGRGRGALMTPPVFLTIPPHRRRISFESTAFN